MPELSDTESCEDEPIPTAEEQAVQSIIEQDDTPYDPPTVPSPPKKSSVKTYKLVNGRLMKTEPKVTKQVSNESRAVSNVVPKSEHIPKKHSFVLKDGECTRTCSTAVLYYSSRSNPTDMDSILGEQLKEEYNSEEPEDQISVEEDDLTGHTLERVSIESIFNVEDLDNIGDICDIGFPDEPGVEYYVENNGEYGDRLSLIVENDDSNGDSLVETELVFDSDYVEEVGANIELSTEETTPVFAEVISCDICDEVFEDRKELMRHIQTMHIG